MPPCLSRPACAFVDQLRRHSGPAGLDAAAAQDAAGRDRQAAASSTPTKRPAGPTQTGGLCVAADHEEIAEAVRAFGGEVRMTSPDCASGTDRVAEVARQLPDVDIFVNVQGDEPELSGACDRPGRSSCWKQNPELSMATLATPIRDREQLDDPACVKVVFDAARAGRLYFSRSPIPHARAVGRRAAAPPNPPISISTWACTPIAASFCCDWPRLPRTPLEKLENLEQLRVLERGHADRVGVVDEPTVGIDTPEDYRAFVNRTAVALR